MEIDHCSDKITSSTSDNLKQPKHKAQVFKGNNKVYRVSLKKYDILSNFYEKLFLYFKRVSNGKLL